MKRTKYCRSAVLALAAFCLPWLAEANCPPTPGSPCPAGPLKPSFGPFRTSSSASPNFRPDGKPVVADLKLVAGKKSVVFGNFGGQLWVVNADGTVPNGIPLSLPADVLSTPAVGDLDGDGKPDIVVGYGSNFDGRPGGFRAYKNNGPSANPVFTLLWDHPSLDTTPPAGADPVFSSPAIADFDNDGTAWVVVGSLDERVWVVKGSDGSNRPGFGPVAGNPSGGFWVGDTIYSSPAIFDLDGDGKLDIIIGVDAHNQAVMPTGVAVPGPTSNGGLVLAINASGALLPGFPIQLDQAISSSPAIGDIDGDGKPEIVIGTGNVYTGTTHRVYAFHCDGSPVTGWPVTVNGQVRTAPALADLDGDGLPDVVVTDDNSGSSGTYHLYAFKGTGNPVVGWTAQGKQPKDFFGATLSAGDPIVADVLGDGNVEILLPTNGEICVFDRGGNQLTDNGTHQPGMVSFFTTGSVSGAAVEDFENDGVAVEVVALAAEPGTSKTAVWVWNPKATGLLPWPQFRHDARHTGVVPGTLGCQPRAVVATNFHPLTPCRVLDTRLAAGPLGGPVLQPNALRGFLVSSVCGIPASAVSISANLTVTGVTAQGELVVYPSDVGRPGTSSISFHPPVTRANNAMVYLSTVGNFSVFNNSAGIVHFILDVNGYFQ
jgi:hypothetical protein